MIVGVLYVCIRSIWVLVSVILHVAGLICISVSVCKCCVGACMSCVGLQMHSIDRFQHLCRCWYVVCGILVSFVYVSVSCYIKIAGLIYCVICVADVHACYADVSDANVSICKLYACLYI